MARSRNIKPEFFLDENLAECEAFARLLLIGLWGIADRDGKLEFRPKRIKAAIFPYDNIDADNLLKQLIDNGLLVAYKVDNVNYLQIKDWDKQQNPHRNEVESDIPDANENNQLDNTRSKDSTTRSKDSTTPADLGFLIDDSGLMIEDSAAFGTKPDCSAPKKKPTSASKKKRKGRTPSEAILITDLPEPFKLTDAMIESARVKGFTCRQYLDAFTEEFVSKNIADERRQKDWNRTWTTWLYGTRFCHNNLANHEQYEKANYDPFEANRSEWEPYYEEMKKQHEASA